MSVSDSKLAQYDRAVNEHNQLIFEIFYKKLGNEILAIEATSKVFDGLWQHISNNDPLEDIRSWLMSSVVQFDIKKEYQTLNHTQH